MQRASDERAMPFAGAAALSVFVVAMGLVIALAMGLSGCAERPDDGAAGGADWERFMAQGGDTTASTSSALVGTPPKRTRTIAALMFNIAKMPDGTTPDPAGVPNATNIMNVISGSGQSQRHMYQEASYGLQDLQADILGPYTLPVANCLTIACCGPSSDKTGNGSTVASIIAGLPKTYDHYFWVYGKIPSGADCGTWGDEGSPNRVAVYSSYSFHQVVGYAQEIGHNMGMTHEPTMTCAGNATFLDDTSQCTHVEYGSTLSYMGNGARHPSAYHKYAQGWIGKCNVVQAGGSGTFTLVPQELPCDGVQLLQIPAPKTRAAPAKGDRQGNGPMLSNYYLEMRGPYGFDSSLKPQVVISIGAALPTTNNAAPYLYVLDMTPEANRADLTNAGLMTVGQSYADPAGGLTITLNAIDATSATVTVTSNATGGATCVDATPFTAPGPGGDSCGPLAVSGADGGAPTDAGAADATRGSGGRAGTGGRADDGGLAGTGGRPGTGGVGATGAGGTGAGAGGTIVAGGTGGARTGTGGAPAAGTGGAPGGSGGDTGNPPPEVTSGCACATAGASTTSTPGGLAWAVAVAAVALARGRRGRRRNARG